MIRTIASCCMLGILLSSGCTTFRGAPNLPFDQGKVFIEQNADGDRNVAEEALRTLANPDKIHNETDRNAQVMVLLAAIDLQYSDFKQDFLAQRQHVGSISDALVLAMTIAGSLTGSAGVKQNYLQGIALVRGSTENYDKNYMLTQTVYALTAQMDANRKDKLSAIYEKLLNQSLVEYPAIAAYNDVLDYYHAGTVLGAIIAIQSDAKGKETTANDEIKTLRTKATPYGFGTQ